MNFIECPWLSHRYGWGNPQLRLAGSVLVSQKSKSSCNSKSASACDPVTRMQSLKPLLGTSNFNVETELLRCQTKSRDIVQTCSTCFCALMSLSKKVWVKPEKHIYIYIYLDLVGALSHQRTIGELKRWLASWCQERKATYMRSTQQPGKWEAQKTWSAAGEAPSLFCCRDVPRLE